jgi:hypothetical protein
MLTSEERKRILAMIEEGRISASDGMQLLEALREAPGAQPARARPGRRLRLRITDAATGQVVANARLPLGAVRLLQQVLGRFVPEIERLELADWLAEAEPGQGRLLDLIEGELGQRVEIFVE